MSIYCRENRMEPGIGERLGDVFSGCGDMLLDGMEWFLHAVIFLLFFIPVMFIVIKAFLFATGKRKPRAGKTQGKEPADAGDDRKAGPEADRGMPQDGHDG